MRIAILEDDLHVGQLITLWLEQEGHDCQLFTTGDLFRKAMGRDSFDLVLLDWNLPDTSGDLVLAWLRSHLDWRIPVIFVTVRHSEEDIVKGLMDGADDYMVKPVRQKELLARITAVSRRSHAGADNQSILEFPPYRIDLDAHAVQLGGAPIELTRKEFDLVLFLFRNAGRMLSRGHILESVWGHNAGMNTRTVDTHVSRIRAKLALTEDKGWRLTSIYHYGYRLEQAAV